MFYERNIMSRYLITGGSGFLGINLIRYLLERGHNVVSLDSAKFDYPENIHVESVAGDIRHPNTVAMAMKDINIVIHCAAALPLYKKEDIFSTDVNGTRNVLEAAYNEGVEPFIHISSTAVYGIPNHHPIYEDDKLDGVGFYGQAKIQAEQICLEYRKRGMCIPIIRPKTFIGPERLGVFAMLYEWAKDGKNFPLIGNGNNRYQLLDVEDLCDAIYLVATLDKKTVNSTFNISAEQFSTMKEDFQVVLDAAGFGKKIKTFPALPMICTLWFLELLHLSPLYKWVYKTACKDSFVSIEKAKKKLGFKPKYSNQDALIRNYQWYLDNFDKFHKNAGISHRTPWEQGILKVIKYFF
jgi:nucleoside-diphosphate-sugar epimerase